MHLDKERYTTLLNANKWQKRLLKNRYNRLVRNGETNEAVKIPETEIRMNVNKIRKILNGDNEKIVSHQNLSNADFNYDAYTYQTPRHKINFYSVMVDDYSIELYSQSEKGTCHKIRHLD